MCNFAKKSERTPREATGKTKEKQWSPEAKGNKSKTKQRDPKARKLSKEGQRTTKNKTQPEIKSSKEGMKDIQGNQKKRNDAHARREATAN